MSYKPANAKTLEQHVRDQTFRSRRHHTLLDGSVLRWPHLAELQARYVGAAHELERRAIGVEFERTVRSTPPAARDEVTAPLSDDELELIEIINAPPVPLAATPAELARYMRQGRAYALAGAGVSATTIAQRIGASVTTVRRYLRNVTWPAPCPPAGHVDRPADVWPPSGHTDSRAAIDTS